jgi:rhamnosyltransferase
MAKNSSKSKRPLVSIVVRTKNEQRTIEKVLKILESQTFKNFEIIHIDDNSTDKTLKIVKEFSKKLPIKMIKLKPGEFSHPYSQNLGASKARGKYLCFLPGHALPVSNTWLEEGLTNFKDPQAAGISGHYTENPVGYYFRGLGKLLLNLEFLWKHGKGKRLKFDPWLTNTNSIIRKSRWQEYPFDEKLSECEDYDWACEMLARGYNIIKDPRFSVFHSHFFVNRPGYWSRLPKWKKLCAMINQRRRPRKSFTKVKIK